MEISSAVEYCGDVRASSFCVFDSVAIGLMVLVAEVASVRGDKSVYLSGGCIMA